MKFLVNFLRFFVGIVFIISGLVKIIDPMGFSFKLEEYFAPDVLNLPFFIPWASLLASAVMVAEILLGLMIILGYKKRMSLIFLLLMTIFFGFLTFYSAYFNKVTDCGCFGDAIKFTPWQSFFKDMILLFFGLILWIGNKHIHSLLKQKTSFLLILFSFSACFFFIDYTKKHLPLIDFRPYKIGVNISEAMIIPPDAPKPIVEYHWKFLVAGQEKTFITNGSYPQVDGNFKEVQTRVISRGYTPPIVNFSIEKDDEDFTQTMLQEEKLVLIVSYDLDKSEANGWEVINKFTQKAFEQNYKIIGLTASVDEAQKVVNQYNLPFEFYFTDQTTLKTIVRSNPAILVLERGTIRQKANFRDAHKIQL